MSKPLETSPIVKKQGEEEEFVEDVSSPGVAEQKLDQISPSIAAANERHRRSARESVLRRLLVRKRWVRPAEKSRTRRFRRRMVMDSIATEIPSIEEKTADTSDVPVQSAALDGLNGLSSDATGTQENEVEDDLVASEQAEALTHRSAISGLPIEALDPGDPISGQDAALVALPNSMALSALPLDTTRRYRPLSRKRAHTLYLIRKHRRQLTQQRHRQRSFRLTVSTVVVASLLSVILIPVGTGFAAYNAYNTLRGVALDGVSHLLAVKNLLPVSKSDPMAVLDTPKLQQARIELNKAESDFLQLQQLVDRPDVQAAVQQLTPQYSSKLDMAQRLVQVAIDMSRMGNELISVALLAAGIVHGSPLASGSTKPLITTADIANIEGTMTHALYYINDIQSQMSQVSLNALPISAAQQKQLTSVLALLPKAQDLIQQGQGVIGIVSWLLGVGHPRRFLVQTMDRAELRPGGGFTGQYGILQIQDGRVAPFSLHDVTELDYAGNGAELGRQAPPAYSSWMRFGNWGLRDSNLSGDYPTTARLSMSVFQEEGGGPIDGDISFTPTFIEHILDVIGPIHVAEYNETITSRNLEDKLHYYQQNYGAIALQRQKSGINNAATRKTFTNLLGKILLDKVRHLQVKQLLKIEQNAIKDIQSRDLEIYFANPPAEAWLIGHGYSGAMDAFTKQDGFMVVQANISISKASQYVHTTEQDQVTLDAQGGATHNLTITLDYQQTGPVYGYDTYADYIRVYAPSNAQFLGGDGFDTGRCLPPPPQPAGTTGTTSKTGSSSPTCCTSNIQITKNPGPGSKGKSSPGCEIYNTSFPSNARYCPNGNYSLGQRGYMVGTGSIYWPVDSLGAPTAFTSDLPGRAMWGGLTLTPKNCISYITLSWYVPHALKRVPGQSPFSMLVQKQGGYIPTVQITVDTSAIKGLKPFSFNGNLVADRLFSLPALKKS